MIRICLLCLLGLTLSLQSLVSAAAISISISESGGDVQLTASGSFDTSQCLSTGPGSALSLLLFDGIDIEVIAGSGAGTVFCTVVFSPEATGLFSANTNTPGTADTGDRVGIQAGTSGDVVYLPSGYVSGNPISGTATFAGETLASLNLNPGTYNYVVGTESVTITVSAASGAPGGPGAGARAVPVMPLWIMALLVTLLAGFGARRLKAR